MGFLKRLTVIYVLRDSCKFVFNAIVTGNQCRRLKKSETGVERIFSKTVRASVFWAG